MLLKNEIAITIFGLLFGLILLFPTVVQFNHLFEEHQHTSCTESTLHFHEMKLDCDIHDFQITVFDFPSFNEPFLIVNRGYNTKVEHYFSLFSSETNPHFLKRGPPDHS